MNQSLFASINRLTYKVWFRRRERERANDVWLSIVEGNASENIQSTSAKLKQRQEQYSLDHLHYFKPINQGLQSVDAAQDSLQW